MPAELILLSASNSSVTLLLAWWSWNKTTVEQFCVSWIGFLRVVCLHQMFFCKQQIPSHGQKPQADRSEKDEEEGRGLKYTELHSGCWQKAAALSQTSKTCLRLNPNPNELMDKTGARTRMGKCFGYGAHRRPTDIKTSVHCLMFFWAVLGKFTLSWLWLVLGNISIFSSLKVLIFQQPLLSLQSESSTLCNPLS